MLQKQKRRLPRLNREILLYFLAFLPPKWRISQDDIKTILVLNMTKIFRQGVGVDNIVSAQSNAERSPSKPALRYRLCQVKLHKFSDLP